VVVLVGWAWMATLFPVSGVVRVGTFVADRIVVPSSLASCAGWSCAVTLWIMGDWEEGWGEGEGEGEKCVAPQAKPIIQRDKHRPPTTHRTTRHRALTTLLKSVLLLLWTFYSTLKIQHRTLEWMDSRSLLESSLRTCPRNAKSNLEMSKIHSGLLPDALDLPLALDYLGAAEEIDPEFCDVHYQFALAYVRVGRYEEMEGRVVKAVLCPFTMQQAYTLYRQYWEAVLKEDRDGNGMVRYEGYQKILKEAVEESTRKEEEKEERKEARRLEAKKKGVFWMGRGKEL